jgi:hypothetical protein
VFSFNLPRVSIFRERFLATLGMTTERNHLSLEPFGALRINSVRDLSQMNHYPEIAID